MCMPLFSPLADVETVRVVYPDAVLLASITRAAQNARLYRLAARHMRVILKNDPTITSAARVTVQSKIRRLRRHAQANEQAIAHYADTLIRIGRAGAALES